MHASEDKLRQVLADVFGIDVTAVNETASVDTIPQWDSLKHMNLVLSLEEQFNVTLTEEQSVQILSYPLIKVVLEEHGVDFGNASQHQQ